MSSAQSSDIHKQLRQDWADREYIEVISINIKKISDFLNSFDLSCRTKLANLNERLSLIERRIEFLEARVSNTWGNPKLMASRVVRQGLSEVSKLKSVRPIKSADPTQARKTVLQSYKNWMRYVPHLWYEHEMTHYPMTELRVSLKREFTKNAQVTDLRVIDRLVHKSEIELYNTKWSFNNNCHIENYLFKSDNLPPKPADFLGKFFAGKD